MSFLTLPLQDSYETTLTQELSAVGTTIYVKAVPTFTFPASETTYLVLNPRKSNMELVEIESYDAVNKTITIKTRALALGASVTGTAYSHSVGSKALISDNYKYWKGVKDVIDSKVDTFNGRTGTVVPTTNDYTWAQVNKATSNIADITTKSHTSLTDIGTNTHAQVDTHIANTSNPHSVTKTQVGLSNVNNLKQNLTAIVAPTVNDDNTAGYSAGSLWIDTVGGYPYTCVSAGTGAASWIKGASLSGVDKATYAEATAGTEDSHYMTPLKTFDAILGNTIECPYNLSNATVVCQGVTNSSTYTVPANKVLIIHQVLIYSNYSLVINSGGTDYTAVYCLMNYFQALSSSSTYNQGGTGQLKNPIICKEGDIVKSSDSNTVSFYAYLVDADSKYTPIIKYFDCALDTITATKKTVINNLCGTSAHNSVFAVNYINIARGYYNYIAYNSGTYYSLTDSLDRPFYIPIGTKYGSDASVGGSVITNGDSLGSSSLAGDANTLTLETSSPLQGTGSFKFNIGNYATGVSQFYTGVAWNPNTYGYGVSFLCKFPTGYTTNLTKIEVFVGASESNAYKWIISNPTPDTLTQVNCLIGDATTVGTPSTSSVTVFLKFTTAAGYTAKTGFLTDYFVLNPNIYTMTAFGYEIN